MAVGCAEYLLYGGELADFRSRVYYTKYTRYTPLIPGVNIKCGYAPEQLILI